MGSRANLKESYEIESKHGAYYTGGQVECTPDGAQLLCQCGGVVNILDVAQGRITSTLNEVAEGEEEDLITTFALGSDGETVVTSHKSGLLKLWRWRDGTMVKQWKSVHKGPVAQLALDGSMLASGGSDSSVRLCDVQLQTCTHSLKGFSGVVSVVKFRCTPDAERKEVFAAADDSVIHSWHVESGEQRAALAGHFSKVTAIVFHWDHQHMISCGRDKVIILWDLGVRSAVRTLPAYEALEGLVLLPKSFTLPNNAKISSGINVASAGENGQIRVWDMKAGRELYTQHNSLVAKATEAGSLAITRLIFNAEQNYLSVVSVDHNIILHKLATFHCIKQLVGFSDEILDIVYVGPDDSHLAVATNSTDIKLYNIADMGCQLLQGHTDLVLALATAPTNSNLLLSCSKDNSVCLWLLDPATDSATRLATGARHTGSVGAAAFARLSPAQFVTAGQDTTLKLWTFDAAGGADNAALAVKHTVVAHAKDINAVCVAPNDKIVATGSQDKTAKLWSGEDLSLLGVLKGHRRGVWCVRFSPVDQVVLTTSADCTVKLWSLQDLSCVKTLEGHDSSVLRGEFVSKGLQILTAGADGLLKLWTVKTSECVTTLEHHDARVWALAVSHDESQLMSGGSDSELVRWRDVTQAHRVDKEKASQLLVLQEQELANLIHAEQLLAALKLALTLERPLQVLRIVQKVLKSGNESDLRSTISQLRPDQKETLLKSANVWNTNTKNCHPAQLVLSILLDDFAVGKLPIVAATIEDALPYTERHFHRLTKLLQDVHMLEYTAICMQPLAK